MNSADNLTLVLLVEDEKIPQIVAVHMLQECGCKADVTSSGQEALDAVSQKEYQIIFMDLGLPDIQGYEVTKKIRASGNNTPIVALTAHNDDETKVRCSTVGMNAFLAKPLTADNIKTVLEQFGIKC